MVLSRLNARRLLHDAQTDLLRAGKGDQGNLRMLDEQVADL